MQNKPVSIVCFSPYPVEGPSVRHRIWAYRGHWKRHGIELTLWPFMTSRFYRIRRRFGLLATAEKAFHFLFCTVRLCVRVARVRRFDGVIIHREVFPLGGPWFERLVHRLNPRLVFDVDDAIWNPPSQTVNQRRLLWDGNRVAKIMRMSRAVVAGNQHLAGYARQHNGYVVVAPTTFDDLGGRANAWENGRAPVVVWIGNLGNAEYLEPIIPVLEQLAAKHRFQLRLVGGDDIHALDIGEVTAERITWAESEEGQWLRTADIGIMPLYDNAYEQGKCGFKLVQYFSAGLPVVASPVGVNRELVEDGVNGFLAATPDEWQAALARLLEDRGLRAAMGEKARETFLERFTREAHAHRWREVLVAAMTPPPEIDRRIAERSTEGGH